MVFAVELLNLDWGSDLNNEQFLDDLILEHIWNSLSLVVRGFRCNPGKAHYILHNYVSIWKLLSWTQIHPLKNLFTSQITTMDPSLQRS